MTTVNRPESTNRRAAASRARAHRPATERLRDQAGEVTKDLAEMANIASDAVQENLGQMREDASEYFEQGRDQVYKAEHTLEQFIRNQPVKSILIAAGVGLCLGRFWKHR
jgi:ElaB/YqjD/DUF883 family membrane-anchored ribosome-binding protein